MRKTFSMILNVTISVDKAKDGKKISWLSFKGWKYGILEEDQKFIDTKPIVKKLPEIWSILVKKYLLRLRQWLRECLMILMNNGRVHVLGGCYVLFAQKLHQLTACRCPGILR